MEALKKLRKKLFKRKQYITFKNNTRYEVLDENSKYYKIKVRKGYYYKNQIISKKVNNIKFITYA